MVLKLPQGHEGSEYVISFEIEQREGSFYSARFLQRYPSGIGMTWFQRLKILPWAESDSLYYGRTLV